MYTKQRGPIDLKVNNTYHLENSNLISRYLVNINLHPGVIFPQVPFGLPIQFPTLADKLRNAGYATHEVGNCILDFATKSIFQLAENLIITTGFG